MTRSNEDLYPSSIVPYLILCSRGKEEVDCITSALESASAAPRLPVQVPSHLGIIRRWRIPIQLLCPLLNHGTRGHVRIATTQKMTQGFYSAPLSMTAVATKIAVSGRAMVRPRGL